MINRRQLIAFGGAALAAAAPAAPAFAQDRTVRIVVGFPPGGSVDVVARMLADRMRVSLGQSVIVDNKAGAGGRLALGELKRAAPDGNTLVLSPSGPIVIHPWLYQNLGYDTLKDFTPIAMASTFDFAITAGPAAPGGDLKAVMAWMKANPQKANFASSGAGSVPHFAGLMLSQAAGVPMTHVAYKGGAPAAQDLMAGQIPLMVDTASETIEHHKAGKVRILAMTGQQRSRALPDVPTAREAGIDVTVDAFFALYGPANMSSQTVQRIDRAAADALKQPDLIERVYGLGLVPAYMGPADLAATQARQLAAWEAPIKSSGFKAE